MCICRWSCLATAFLRKQNRTNAEIGCSLNDDAYIIDSTDPDRTLNGTIEDSINSAGVMIANPALMEGLLTLDGFLPAVYAIRVISTDAAGLNTTLLIGKYPLQNLENLMRHESGLAVCRTHENV